MKSILLCYFLLCLIKLNVAYIITVDSHAEECFFDPAQAGSKLGLMFETIEGGFLDIDVRIVGPDGKVIYQGDRETNGKYTFAAYETGTYTYCFSNQMSTVTPKVVMFTMEISEAPSGTPGAPGEQEAGHTKLDDMIRELSGGLIGIKHEQEYMHIRDRIHRDINESTNSKVVWWSIFEAGILVLMTVGQIYYLKRFFEVKRVV